MRLSRALFAMLLCIATVLAALPTGSGAAGSKQLRRVRGNVGYQPTATAPVSAVFGRFDLPDDAFAVTQAQSAAEIALPDSSIISLGENTRVQVGAFNDSAEGPGSTVIVNGGALRFDVRRPAGGRANYTFVTNTSQIAVRGTIGLLSLVNGITSVACVECAADSVVVTVGAQTFALATGQLLVVSATSVVTVGAATSEALQTFSQAGLNPAPTGPGTIGGGSGAAGSGAGAAGGGISGSTLGAIAAGALVAGVAVAVTASTSTPRPAGPTPTPNATGTPTIAPVTPTPTPTATPGSPTPTPTPSPSPTASATPVTTPTPTPSPTPTATPTIPGSVIVTGTHRAASSGAATSGTATTPPLPSEPRAPGAPTKAGR